MIDLTEHFIVKQVNSQNIKTEEVCACCYFCHMIDLTEHFIVKQVNSQNIKSYCFKMLGLELGY